MERQQIIMNFTHPPSAEDLHVLATAMVENLPDELAGLFESLAIAIEDFADDAVQEEFELEDPYDMIALYRSGKQISPGVESKVANDDDVLILYRRALLDMWCETGEDLGALVRQAIIEELGHNFDFSDEEIDDMNQRHYQGML